MDYLDWIDIYYLWFWGVTLSAGQGMLPSGISRKREPYTDDWGKEGRESGSLWNHWTSRQRTNEDHEDRDDFEQLDEEKASPIP